MCNVIYLFFIKMCIMLQKLQNIAKRSYLNKTQKRIKIDTSFIYYFVDCFALYYFLVIA